MTLPVTAQFVDPAACNAAIASLSQLLGARLSSAAPVREQHGKDASYHPYVAPDAVAFARSTEEVSEIVKICAHHKVPLIPFGAGTGMEGNVLALRGGVCIDLSGMNQILQVNTGDLDATVEAGVTHEQLNERLRDEHLFFSVDPGANATIGGMAATRASGSNSVRYGTMRENVLSLKVVLADGRVIRTAGRARKSAAGYDLTRLFVGSEGTLGVITEVTVRLYGVPAAISAAVCSFATVEAAVNAVIQTIQAGVPVARIEVANAIQMDAINKYSKLELPVAPTLWLEFHGTEASVAEQAEMVQKITVDHGGANFSWTTRPEDRQKLWRARHDVVYADRAMRPGGQWSRPYVRPRDIENDAAQRVVAGRFANPFLGALRSSRLLRGVEACAHQHTRGAKDECRCQPAAVGNSPCSHDRFAPSKRIHNLRNERKKTPRHSMATCFSALSDEDIRSCRSSLLREGD
jgi:D-lactate dehydrogenase (cytochrome)